MSGSPQAPGSEEDGVADTEAPIDGDGPPHDTPTAAEAGGDEDEGEGEVAEDVSKKARKKKKKLDDDGPDDDNPDDDGDNVPPALAAWGAGGYVGPDPSAPASGDWDLDLRAGCLWSGHRNFYGQGFGYVGLPRNQRYAGDGGDAEDPFLAGRNQGYGGWGGGYGGGDQRQIQATYRRLIRTAYWWRGTEEKRIAESRVRREKRKEDRKKRRERRDAVRDARRQQRGQHGQFDFGYGDTYAGQEEFVSDDEDDEDVVAARASALVLGHGAPLILPPADDVVVVDEGDTEEGSGEEADGEKKPEKKGKKGKTGKKKVEDEDEGDGEVVASSSSDAAAAESKVRTKPKAKGDKEDDSDLIVDDFPKEPAETDFADLGPSIIRTRRYAAKLRSLEEKVNTEATRLAVRVDTRLEEFGERVYKVCLSKYEELKKNKKEGEVFPKPYDGPTEFCSGMMESLIFSRHLHSMFGHRICKQIGLGYLDEIMDDTVGILTSITQTQLEVQGMTDFPKALKKALVYKVTRRWKVPLKGCIDVMIPTRNTLFYVDYVVEEEEEVEDDGEIQGWDQSYSSPGGDGSSKDGPSRKHEESVEPVDPVVTIEMVTVGTDFQDVMKKMKKKRRERELDNRLRKLVGMPMRREASFLDADEKEKEEKEKKAPKAEAETISTSEEEVPFDLGQVYFRRERSRDDTQKRMRIMVRLPDIPKLSLPRGGPGNGDFRNLPRQTSVSGGMSQAWHLIIRVPSPPVIRVRRSRKCWFGKITIPGYTDDLLRQELSVTELTNQSSNKYDFEQRIERSPVRIREAEFVDFTGLYKVSSVMCNPRSQTRFDLPEELIKQLEAEKLLANPFDKSWDDAEDEDNNFYLADLLPEIHNSPDGSGTLAHVLTFLPVSDVLGSMMFVCLDFSKAAQYCICNRKLTQTDIRDLFGNVPKKRIRRRLTSESGHYYLQKVFDAGLDYHIQGPLGESLFRRLVLENPNFDPSLKTPFCAGLQFLDGIGDLLGGNTWDDEDAPKRPRHPDYGYDGGYGGAYGFDEWGGHHEDEVFSSSGRRARRSRPRAPLQPLTLPLPMYFLLREFKDRKVLLSLIERASDVTKWCEFVLASCPQDPQIVKAIIDSLKKEGKGGVPHTFWKILVTDGTMRTLNVLLRNVSILKMKSGGFRDLLCDAAAVGNLPILKFLWGLKKNFKLESFPARGVKLALPHPDVLRWILKNGDFEVPHAFATAMCRTLSAWLAYGAATTEGVVTIIKESGVSLRNLDLYDMPEQWIERLMENVERLPLDEQLFLSLCCPSVADDRCFSLFATMEDATIPTKVANSCIAVAALRGFSKTLKAIVLDKKLRFQVSDGVLRRVAAQDPGPNPPNYVGHAVMQGYALLDPDVLLRLRNVFVMDTPGIIRPEADENLSLLIRRGPKEFDSLIVLLRLIPQAPADLILDVFGRSRIVPGHDAAPGVTRNSADVVDVVERFVSRGMFDLADECLTKFGKEIVLNWDSQMQGGTDSLGFILSAILDNQSAVGDVSGLLPLCKKLLKKLPKIKDLRTDVTFADGSFQRLIITIFRQKSPELIKAFFDRFEDPLSLFKAELEVQRHQVFPCLIEAFSTCERSHSRVPFLGDDHGSTMKVLLELGLDPSSPAFSSFFFRLFSNMFRDSSYVEAVLLDPRCKIGEDNMPSEELASSLTMALESVGRRAQTMNQGYGAGPHGDTGIHQEKIRDDPLASKAFCRVFDILLANPDFTARDRVLCFRSAVLSDVFEKLVNDETTRKKLTASDVSGLLQRSMYGVPKVVRALISGIDRGDLDGSTIDPRKMFDVLAASSADLLAFALSKVGFLRSIGGVPADFIEHLSRTSVSQGAGLMRFRVCARLFEKANVILRAEAEDAEASPGGPVSEASAAALRKVDERLERLEGLKLGHRLGAIEKRVHSIKDMVERVLRSVVPRKGR